MLYSEYRLAVAEEQGVVRLIFGRMDYGSKSDSSY
jgi:hypothetical protein